ncbi:MAG: hypothetical protein JNL79_40665 [Myxococcales bacterium]|nr:hypothetical protein [Myxococcales bacterium]
MKTRWIRLCTTVILFGCSSTEKASEPTDSATANEASADTGEAIDAAAADAVEEATVDLKPPTITSVTKMGGALHVYWKNNQACDSVVGERKSETEGYKALFTVPGTVNNKMDGTATVDTTYTYRARCKVGANLSPFSAEMSANPVR